MFYDCRYVEVRVANSVRVGVEAHAISGLSDESKSKFRLLLLHYEPLPEEIDDCWRLDQVVLFDHRHKRLLEVKQIEEVEFPVEGALDEMILQQSGLKQEAIPGVLDIFGVRVALVNVPLNVVGNLFRPLLTRLDVV